MRSDLRGLAEAVADAEAKAAFAGHEALRCGAFDVAMVLFSSVRTLKAVLADVEYDCLDDEESFRSQLKFEGLGDQVRLPEVPF